MNRHRNAGGSFGHDMMAPVDTLKRPSRLLKLAQQILTAQIKKIHLSWCVGKMNFHDNHLPSMDFPSCDGEHEEPIETFLRN
jgi:hypothetical protein